MAIEQDPSRIIVLIRQRQNFLYSLQPSDPAFEKVFGNSNNPDEKPTSKEINTVMEIAALEGLQGIGYVRQVRQIIIENGLFPEGERLETKLVDDFIGKASILRSIVDQNIGPRNASHNRSHGGSGRRSGNSKRRN